MIDQDGKKRGGYEAHDPSNLGVAKSKGKKDMYGVVPTDLSKSLDRSILRSMPGFFEIFREEWTHGLEWYHQ